MFVMMCEIEKGEFMVIGLKIKFVFELNWNQPSGYSNFFLKCN